ncbi:MAG: VWA domain-containing protein [Bacteroidota bacterium]|nr:VWA domain-containing protein [Bacteroidota bacterium]
MVFANKELLWILPLLIILPMLFWYGLKKRKSQATLKISSVASLKNTGISYKRYFRHLLFLLRTAAIGSIIIALARPQLINNSENRTSEGIDIIIALDISSSMLARDFDPNRLEASKEVAMKFINGRENDRIGLVVFSGESFTQCPLTTDHAALLNLFKSIEQGMIEDGTAIGLGLLNSVNRLKESKAKSKVIILLTDGVNNKGEADPLTAADIAAKYGLRVYTIGVGKNGYAPYPVQTMFGMQYQQMEVKIDEETLKIIAQKTGGEYFRATNNEALKEVYKKIDKLEKSEIEVKMYQTKTEKFLVFVIIAALLLLPEIILRSTVFRNIP